MPRPDIDILTGGRSLLERDKLLAIAAAVISTNGLKGVVAEMGVFRGGTARLLAILGDSDVHLFDTFSGLPSDDINGKHRQGEFAESLDEVREFLGYGGFHFHPGIIPATVPPEMKFRFIHMDLDTQQSTEAALDCVIPQMVPRGTIVMDDWHWASCPGVTAALERRFPPERLIQITPHQVKIVF